MSQSVPAVKMVGITKRFPGVIANDSVDLEVPAGEVHALLGENGAGKSTISHILIGRYRPDEGQIVLHGESVEFHSPGEAIAAGIGMVHQHFELVGRHSVAENIVLGDKHGEGRRLLPDWKAIERQIRELGNRYGLAVDPRATVEQLSVGEQQRVEILKALYHGAQILILDEPTAVLTPQESEKLFEILRNMTAEGRTVIFISHKLPEVMAVADRITVLKQGQAVGTLVAAETSAQQLAEMMVGRGVRTVRRRRHDQSQIGDTVLTVQELQVPGRRGDQAVRGVSIQVRAGEIVGIAGVAGNGQRELADAITGVSRLSAGQVVVDGRLLKPGRPQAAIRAGVAYIPEDRLGTGVAAGLSISPNVVLKSYRSHSVGPVLKHPSIRERALRLIQRYGVQTPGLNTPVGQLSGGNIQLVVLGREFEGRPRVLVAASPTRGLDVGKIETVRGYLDEAAAEGLAVLLISEDLDEILDLADRVLVMYEGRIVKEIDGSSADRMEIGLWMAGGKE